MIALAALVLLAAPVCAVVLWRALRYTGDMLDDDPEGVIAQVRRVLAGR